MDITIFGVLIIAWAGTCSFYLIKIYKIARSFRLSLFSPLHKYNKTIRAKVKALYVRIFVITIVFIISLLLAYYVQTSSSGY